LTAVVHPERLPFARRQSVELTLQRNAGGEPLLDFGESIFGGEVQR
jgi:hypothetical protein